jgi:membrane glycosyltransferase
MGAAFAISPVFAAWLSPAALGMVFAPVFSIWSGSTAGGDRFARAGLLSTPEEAAPPASFTAARRLDAAYAAVRPATLLELLSTRTKRAARAAIVDSLWPLDRHGVHVPLATAVAKAERHGIDPEALDAMGPSERMALLNDPAALERVSRHLNGRTRKAPLVNLRPGPRRRRSA